MSRRLTKQNPAAGGSTDYVYDTAGNLVAVTGPANLTLALMLGRA